MIELRLKMILIVKSSLDSSISFLSIYQDLVLRQILLWNAMTHKNRVTILLESQCGWWWHQSQLITKLCKFCEIKWCYEETGIGTWGLLGEVSLETKSNIWVRYWPDKAEGKNKRKYSRKDGTMGKDPDIGKREKRKVSEAEGENSQRKSGAK